MEVGKTWSRSPVPRHDHGTALLQPNGAVWVMGGNRVQLNPTAPSSLRQTDGVRLAYALQVLWSAALFRTCCFRSPVNGAGASRLEYAVDDLRTQRTENPSTDR